jgi:HD-GYP domain-containing protein (c-di-GMP phosphodiesterase class II)
MAIDQRPDLFLPGPPLVLEEAPARPSRRAPVARDGAIARHPAPLRPLDRAWLMTWRTELDPSRWVSVPATTMVSHLVREQAEPVLRPSLGWRYLAPAATTDLLLPGHRSAPAWPTAEPGTERPMPRSMGITPAHAYGVARRTAEVLAVLSACLDPAERRPQGHAVRVAYLGSRIAAELEMGDDLRCGLLYAGLLRDAGSTGLEPADVEPAESSHGRRGLGLRHSGQPAAPAASSLASAAAPHLSRPDRAAALVRVLGLSPGIMEAVASAEERWDGKGPRHERRTAIPTGARLLTLSVTAALAAAEPGATPLAIERTLRRERGGLLDPTLVDRVLELGRGGLWADLAAPSLLERMLELEPLHRIRQSDDAGLDAIAGAFADLVDTRTPMMGRHGRRVAAFAARTSVALGLEARIAVEVRRAALLHDLGKLLVPIAYLEKPAALSAHEKHVIDDHARFGAAVLERSRVLGGLAPLIAGHHERLDGSGRFPVLVDDDRELGARIIAIADRFEAMTAERPYRPAMTPAHAWAELHREVSEPRAGVVLRVMERTLGG